MLATKAVTIHVKFIYFFNFLSFVERPSKKNFFAARDRGTPATL